MCIGSVWGDGNSVSVFKAMNVARKAFVFPHCSFSFLNRFRLELKWINYRFATGKKGGRAKGKHWRKMTWQLKKSTGAAAEGYFRHPKCLSTYVDLIRINEYSRQTNYSLFLYHSKLPTTYLFICLLIFYYGSYIWRHGMSLVPRLVYIIADINSRFPSLASLFSLRQTSSVLKMREKFEQSSSQEADTGDSFHCREINRRRQSLRRSDRSKSRTEQCCGRDYTVYTHGTSFDQKRRKWHPAKNTVHLGCVINMLRMMSKAQAN